MNKAFLGADPGLSGAIAVIQYSGQAIAILPMPVSGKEVDVATIVEWLTYRTTLKLQGVVAYIEKVSSRPGQGVVSVFKFGFVTGILHGIFRTLGIPLYTVTPQAWKKEILAGTDKSKQASIDYVLRAYPNVKLFRTKRSRTYDHNMADALCIAEYAKRKYP